MIVPLKTVESFSGPGQTLEGFSEKNPKYFFRMMSVQKDCFQCENLQDYNMGSTSLIHKMENNV